MAELTQIFKPITVGGLELKNRLVMLATGTGFSGEGINDRLWHYYMARARGGVGLIVVPACPSPGAGGNILPEIYADHLIPGYRRLTDGIHQGGAKAAIQLLMMYWRKKGPGAPLEVIGPSEGTNRVLGKPMRPLSVEEVQDIVHEYGEAARRAGEAGFDMVEIQAGMGFVINRFLSPVTNQRTDHYGGGLENRMRLLLEVVQAVKKGAGEDFPLSVRFSAEEFMPGGHTLQESRQVASVLQAAGVHLLDVASGWEESPTPISYMSVPRAAFVHHAEEIKKAVRVPVVAAYRINDPLVAEEILRSGRADLIGMSRAFLADPNFPAKAREGRLEEIRRCIACNHCLDLTFAALTRGTPAPITCSVNPSLGREAEVALMPASTPKKVLVIGGGPGGMEAAQVAAIRSHRVTLMEGGEQLGGQLLTAVLPPDKEELGYLTQTLTAQVRKAGVEVRLNCPASPLLIQREHPDAVILATGAVPDIPDIPGAKGKKVVNPLQVLTGKASVGERVVVVGGGFIGCETALYLARQGKKVTILSRQERVGHDIGLTSRWVVLGALRQAGVRMEAKASTEEITEQGVKARREGGNFDFFEADTVVLAGGMRPQRELASLLEGKVKELYPIGDCVEPRRIREAIWEGFEIARKV